MSPNTDHLSLEEQVGRRFQDGRERTSGDIARDFNLSVRAASDLLCQLVKAGVLTTKPLRGGIKGYSRARRAAA